MIDTQNISTGSQDHRGIVSKITMAIRTRFPLLSFLFFVVVPSIIYFIYMAAFATPLYQSEFRIQIRAANGNVMPSFGSILGMTGANSQASDNGHAVTQYLVSRDAMEDLEKTAGLRARFTRPSIDWLSRLSPDASAETLQRYWNKRIVARFDSTTGTVVVTVSAFTPEDAASITNACLEISENLLNGMTSRARADSLKFAQSEVASSKRELQSIDAALLAARTRTGIIDVPKQVSVALTRVAKLQESVDLAQADLAVRSRYLSPGEPGLELARDKVRLLNSELGASKSEITSGNSNTSLAFAANTFAQMEAQRMFAEKRFQTGLASLNAALSDAQRQQLYLERIVSPRLPQEATWPRLFPDQLIFMGFAVALWALVLILGMTIKDHIPD